MASAHVLAAAGGEGMLEVDANPNPLRSELAPPLARVVEGEVALGELPGLGFEVNLDQVSELCNAAQTID
jgi:L-alanine-DL-glutamate epimerase-like enolase superfamily enzyme